jgi:hypothetical protein
MARKARAKLAERVPSIEGLLKWPKLGRLTPRQAEKLSERIQEE